MSKKAPEGTTHISVHGFLKKDERGDMWFFNNYGVWQRWTRSLRSDWMVIENRSAVEVGLRAHLEAALARAEYTEECIESDRGKGQSVEQLYADGEMPDELVAARAFLAQLDGEQP